MYIFNTVPKQFTDEVGQTRTVTGIVAVILGPIPVALYSNFKREFYIAFRIAESEKLYGERNATTEQFIERAIANGATPEEANVTVLNIVKTLEFGTTNEKYVAALGLASMYSHTLLPLAEQPGQPE